MKPAREDTTLAPTARCLTRRTSRAIVALLAAATVAACDNEDRPVPDTLGSEPRDHAIRQSPLRPGELVPEADTQPPVPYEENAYAISEGQKFFVWYNCAGCHGANGGGGMGPPLIDGKWVYGSSPENVYATIMEGRPNGMPSWRGKIPRSQVWQIVAYVRTMSGLTPQIARSSRTDHMMALPGSQLLMQEDSPKQSFVPPASITP